MDLSETMQRVRDRIQELGVSQLSIADRAGLHQSQLSNLLKGEIVPLLSTFLNLCKALETSPNDLLGFEDPLRRKVFEENESLLRYRDSIRAADRQLDKETAPVSFSYAADPPRAPGRPRGSSEKVQASWTEKPTL